MPDDWITIADVQEWLGPMADPERLADATAAAKRHVEDRRSDLDLVASADDAPADVKNGTVLLAGLIYQARSSPTGYAAFGDGLVDVSGTQSQAYGRAMVLIGEKRPVAL